MPCKGSAVLADSLQGMGKCSRKYSKSYLRDKEYVNKIRNSESPPEFGLYMEMKTNASCL